MNPLFRLDGKHVLVIDPSGYAGPTIADYVSKIGGRTELATPSSSVNGTVVERIFWEALVERAWTAFHAVVYVCVPRQLIVTGQSVDEDVYMERYFSKPVAFIRSLLARGHIASQASIVFIVSNCAYVGIQGTTAQAAAEAALVATARVWALELAHRGIRVNCVSLAATINSGGDFIIGDDAAPLGRGSVGDIAGAILFFICETGRWITGQTLVLNGASPGSE